MPSRVSPPIGPEPLRFSIAGLIARCDPLTRVLRIAGRELCVSTDTTVAGLGPVLDVIAHGHRGQWSQRWGMTSGTRDPAADT
jgi:hypothetical protein